MTSRKRMTKIWILICVWFFGDGVTIHAIASELYEKGGYQEILQIQGEWIGIALINIAFLLLLCFIFSYINYLENWSVRLK